MFVHDVSRQHHVDMDGTDRVPPGNNPGITACSRSELIASRFFAATRDAIWTLSANVYISKHALSPHAYLPDVTFATMGMRQWL